MTTKLVDDSVLDAALDDLSANCDKMVGCSWVPTNYTEANATYALADVAIDSGDFTKADGDVSGRKTTVAAQSGVTVDTSGICTHIALLDTGNTTLKYVTESDTIKQTGTAQAGGASTITLASGASATDDEYNNYGVRITSGTGSGQSRKISDYVGSTKVATVSSAWTVQPDATSVYEVFGKSLSDENTADFAAWDIEIEDPV